MQRAQHQVSRQGCFHGDFGGFVVANLAHHDDVRIGAQKSAQGRGKIKADFGCTWTWRSPGWVISTGSSAVQIFRSGVLIRLSAECSVVVFPAPVGPTERISP